MKENVREFLVGLITFVTFITFIISCISLIAYFSKGTSDELAILALFGIPFLISFAITCFVRGGFSWLFAWFTTLP